MNRRSFKRTYWPRGEVPVFELRRRAKKDISRHVRWVGEMVNRLLAGTAAANPYVDGCTASSSSIPGQPQTGPQGPYLSQLLEQAASLPGLQGARPEPRAVFQAACADSSDLRRTRIWRVRVGLVELEIHLHRPPGK